MSQWCTIESDPAVFSELIATFGVQNIEVQEIYSLDSSEQRKEKSHGLIFLFKWRSEADEREVLDPSESPVYFARQIVHNACATQAILGVLLNSDGIVLGGVLDDFKAFTSEIDSESKGIAIGNSEVLRGAHNSFARPEPFLQEESKSSSEAADAYHFIAYVPCHGGVYEIDGMKSGPIYLGDIGDNEGWWEVAKPAIEAVRVIKRCKCKFRRRHEAKKMNRYSATETHFALLSVGEQRKTVLENEVSFLTKRLSVLDLAVHTGVGKSSVLSDGFTIGDNTDIIAEQRIITLSAIENLKEELRDEFIKLRKQKEENVRRRHNYIPMAITLLRELAGKRKLSELIAAAEQRRTVNAVNRKNN